MWCNTGYLACAEPLRRAGLSAAAEIYVLLIFAALFVAIVVLIKLLVEPWSFYSN